MYLEDLQLQMVGVCKVLEKYQYQVLSLPCVSIFFADLQTINWPYGPLALNSEFLSNGLFLESCLCVLL